MLLHPSANFWPSRKRIVDVYRQVAVYVDKIFKGAKTTDLPVQQATKFELIVNLTGWLGENFFGQLGWQHQILEINSETSERKKPKYRNTIGR